jgi:predicted O-methyltransferase YrrM
MKDATLDQLPIVPEEYETSVYETIQNFFSSSSGRHEMLPEQDRFINGLIRYYRPKNILELGVLYGGGQ